MTITNFDKKNLQAMRVDIDAALATIAAKHGIKMRLGTMRFDAMTFSAKIEAEAGGADDRKAAQAVSLALAYGIDASEPSTFKGREGATLVEYNGRARSKPWLYALNGLRYMTDDRGLRLLFPATEKSLSDLEVAPPTGLSLER